MSDAVEQHRRALDEFSRRVDTAGGRWDQTSPCEGWTAGDVVDHVTSNHRSIAERLGATAPEGTGDRAADWTACRDAATTALGSADLTQVTDTPFGPMPAEAFLGIITSDTLVHTWDLARATGGDEALPEDMAQATYDNLLPLDEAIRIPGVFGPKVPVPDDASVQDRLLGFLGRHP
jgi:uncharacterized protein (TIGR03086 family)